MSSKGILGWFFGENEKDGITSFIPTFPTRSYETTRDFHDERDIPVIHAMNNVMLREGVNVDLRPKITNPPVDQGENGNSAAFAVSFLYEYHLKTTSQGKRDIAQQILKANRSVSLPSQSLIDDEAEFCMDVKSVEEGQKKVLLSHEFDLGGEEDFQFCGIGPFSLRTTLKAMKRYGVAKSSEDAIKSVVGNSFFHVPQYCRLDQNINDLRRCLWEGNPFAFLLSITNQQKETFENEGIWHKSVAGPSNRYQCVVAVGFDDDNFIVRNSFGIDWGNDGYFYLPLEVVNDRNLCHDFWALSRSFE